MDGAAIIRAVRDAQALGIRILNCSFSFAHQDFQDALSDYTGLIVCAAGNDSQDTDISPKYPSCYNFSNIISVGATSGYDNICDFSNYGENSVDLFAPGGNIYSCYNSETLPYKHMSGTSMSAPFVSGVAALLLSAYPELTTAQLKYFLLAGVDVDEGLVNKCVTAGRINAHKSLLLCQRHIHNFEYINMGENIHRRVCYCDLVVVESHNGICDPYSDSHHMMYCDCGYVGLKYHNYVTYDEYSVSCTDCGNVMSLMSVEPELEVE